MKLKTYSKDHVIFYRGDESNSYLMILDGEVKLYKRKFPQKRSFIRTMGKGDALGELGIIESKPRSLTWISNEWSILKIDVPIFKRTMKFIVKKKLEDKISFICKWFPRLKTISQKNLETLAFTCRESPKKKG